MRVFSCWCLHIQGPVDISGLCIFHSPQQHYSSHVAFFAHISSVWHLSRRNTLRYQSTCVVSVCGGFISGRMLPRRTLPSFSSGLWCTVASVKVESIISWVVWRRPSTLACLLTLIESERTGVDLWKCFAVMFVSGLAASLLHLWFIPDSMHKVNG